LNVSRSKLRPPGIARNLPSVTEGGESKVPFLPLSEAVQRLPEVRNCSPAVQMGEQFSLSVQLPAQEEIEVGVGDDADDSDSGMEWSETEWEGCT
jgi:hypothetical protein